MDRLGDLLPLWSVAPFAGLLLSIALLPQLAPNLWHSQRNQVLVAAGWSLPVLALLGWLGVGAGGNHASLAAIEHAALEYVAFICLLGSLFVITGGILLEGDLPGRPAVNTAFLAVGALLANLVGTTGASMLLIRPVLVTNSERSNTWHIPLFFIFVVSNVGGLLTPIGDPPLFLGYLRGVPFSWTLSHLWSQWLFMVGALLVGFFVLDRWMYARESAERIALDQRVVRPLKLSGWPNLALLALVVASVLWLSPTDAHDFRQYHAREIAMVLLSAASLALTPAAVRTANRFEWAPILEVAGLFAGIFVTMIPATALLEAHGDKLGITAPWQYFWTAGALSSFLDNAPTYVTFAAMACGSYADVCPSADALGTLADHGPSAQVLAAISLGSVFMGANSYIGNGPNFMVRAIATQAGYQMPSFFAYCGWAMAVLGPLYVVLTLGWLL